jgi:GAF domain-containing protein
VVQLWPGIISVDTTSIAVQKLHLYQEVQQQEQELARAT